MEYLFDDVFSVKDVDMDGKKFDKVTRLHCHSENYEMELILDVASDVYPLKASERFHCILVSALEVGGMNLADRFEYVMHGKIYKAENMTSTVGSDGPSSGTTTSSSVSPSYKVAIFVSFGGLLMRLMGDPRHWRDLKLGDSIYILIRKI